jgi:hypothetical protein
MTDRAITGADWNVSLLFEWQIPINLHGGLERYLKHGIRPGDFLFSILTNNLVEAHLRAGDPEAEASIGRIVRFLCDEASAHVWGSRTKVQTWIDAKQLEREKARTS